MVLAKSSLNANPSTPLRAGAESGFSLIETMVATMLLAGALVTTAQLMVIALRANMAAQKQSVTSTLAQEKLEQLRGLAWGFDELGLPVNDFSTNLTVEPANAVGGVGLTPSPGDALASNMTGYVDYLDRYG